MLKILELFGGIGSPRKALINLGIEHKCIDYVEIDEKAVRTYNALFENIHKPQSVVNYNLMPDILVHGSPCQDFSRAGKRLGGNDEDKTRSSLMFETLKIIENLGVWKPKFVVWENVKGVLDKDMIHSFNKYLSKMEELGYTNSFEVLNSMDFGIPQSRNRVYTISILGRRKFDFDKLVRVDTKHISEFLEDTKEEKYIVSQPSMLKKIPCSDKFIKNNYGSLKVIEDSCLTITTKQMRCPNAGIVKLDDNRYRYLTERECWRLMGFEDSDFENALKTHKGTQGKLNGTLYKQAGNSIVVQVLEAIFRELLGAKGGINGRE